MDDKRHISKYFRLFTNAFYPPPREGIALAWTFKFSVAVEFQPI